MPVIFADSLQSCASPSYRSTSPKVSAFDAFRQAKQTAIDNQEDSFTFRGKSYRRSRWGNGVSVFKRSSKKGKKRSKRSKKGKKSRS